MRYNLIRDMDIANGPGIRVSIFVQGCNRHCKGCFNSETWDFNKGKPFTDKELDELVRLVQRDHISGLTILGGEPLESANIETVARILKCVKDTCPNKSNWLYSSFLYEDILNFFETPVLDNVDYLVDGEFIEELKDPKLHFRGSSNQRIINVKESKKQGHVILATEYYE